MSRKTFFTVTPLSKTLALILFIALPFLGFYLGVQYQRSLGKTTAVTALPVQKMETKVTGTFKGKMPCADCSGIDETLTLSATSADGRRGTYKLSDVYEGKSSEPFVDNGNWKIIEGSVGDKDAEVLQLTSGNSGDPVYFLIVNGSTLRMLNSNMEEIDAPFNETLTKS